MARLVQGFVCCLLMLTPSVSAAPLAAQEWFSVSTLHWINGSVRSAGLHGAGAALVGDAGALFSNPAALATLRHIAFEGTYRREPGAPPPRLERQAVAATGAGAFRLRQFDLGIGLKYVEFDPASFVRPPSTTPYEAEAVGALVYRYGLVAVGGSLRYARLSLDPLADQALSGDLGLAIAVFDIMAIGFAVQNLDDNWYRESGLGLRLPQLTRLGFTMNYVDPQETFRLLSVFEAQWSQAGPSRLILGGEAGLVVYGVGLIGRAAYSSSGDAAFTFGGSLALGDLQLDYAYADFDVLGRPAHRVGLRLSL